MKEKKVKEKLTPDWRNTLHTWEYQPELDFKNPSPNYWILRTPPQMLWESKQNEEVIYDEKTFQTQNSWQKKTD